MQLAIQFPESLLVWCHQEYREHINLAVVLELMHHQRMMLSYNSSSVNYPGNSIGYVEDSPFINVNKKVSYPTWQMSGNVGVIQASVLITFKDKTKLDSDFDYYLNSIAKVGMPLGLFCYSEPRLVLENNLISVVKSSNFTLFKFVKQHYKTRWVFLLLLNLIIYEFRFPFLALVYSLLFKNRNKFSLSLDNITVQLNRSVVKRATMDVIIPTIGRKNYLYDVLKDLSQQTHLPVNVIIVEQNPQVNSVSELDYLHTEKWPFAIKHIFTHQAGACNARNLALAEVNNEWVFMADDDIRIEKNFLQKVFLLIKKEGFEQITFGCYPLKYSPKKKLMHKTQWTSFGSGCSIVKAENIKSILYNTNFEFGYGEDADFGMQLRNSGFDVFYSPNPEILHLQAAIGGFRTKPTLAWHGDLIQPKPSPTVMLYKILNLSEEQINGYKTVLFFKFYKVQSIVNPFLYFSVFKKQWSQSVYWANQLKNKK